MFGLVNRGELDGTTESEFESLIAKLRRFLLLEHKEDGTHGAIHADSINLVSSLDGVATGGLVAEGNGDFAGDVYANHSINNSGIENYTGLLSNLWTGMRGLRIRNAISALFGADWSIAADYAPSPNTNGLMFVDNFTVITPTGVMRLEPDSALGLPGIAYRLIPHGSTLLKLGDNDSGPGNYLSGVYASAIESGSGYKERFRTTPMGEWTSVAFNAGDFTATGGMTWTVAAGDIATFAYTLVGKTMTVALHITNTTIGGVLANTIQIKIPGGFTSARSMFNATATLIDNGFRSTGFLGVGAGSTNIVVRKTDITNYLASAAATTLIAQLSFEVL